MLFCILLITFLLLLSYVTSASALFIASFFGFGLMETKVVTMGSGLLVGLVLILWALLDKKRQ
jgi:hypothetical protein